MSSFESTAPVCVEKACLRLCALAESHHQRAIQGLAGFIGKLKKSDSEELARVRGDHTQDRGEAPEALERHIAEHGVLTMMKPTLGAEQLKESHQTDRCRTKNHLNCQTAS